MASISKRASGTWQNTSYGIRATATDTITTLPTTIYSDGTNATISIKGNTVQNGTPTPANPVSVVGVGELDNDQYKIPILSAGQTTPIYLGEVQSTRQIKKLVLTGTIVDGATNITAQGIIYITPFLILKSVGAAYCTHFKYVNQGQGPGMPSNSFTTSGGAGTSLWFKTDYTSVADFRAYLADQYTAGTPVTVWYVLAESETGIVNEPLMKIDSYADEVSGVSIPTTDGANTLSVDTTVQPSEVSVNYHGWHMGTVRERVSGEWD